MNPVSWTQKRGFYMGKLSYEDKVKIYYEKKKGRSRKDIASKYKIQESNVQYLVRLIDKNGFDVLRTEF